MKDRLWDIFVSREEYNTKVKDKNNRIMSYSIDTDFVNRPIVSEYIFNQGFKPKYPENRKFAVSLSHDIDLLYLNANLKHSVINLIKSFLKNDRTKFLNSILSLYKPKIWDNYDIQNLIKINTRYNLKATFFFLAVSKENFACNYNINDLKHILDKIENNGSEVGLHGSYFAYKNIGQLQKETNEINAVTKKPVLGYRNHNLNFDISITWTILELLGFKYDSTFGFADQIGFRNGMCYPFHPYNIIEDRFFNITEIPLHFMDVTLFKYMKLSYNEAYESFQQLVEEIEKVHGVLTFLWHNTNLNKSMIDFYEKCLSYLIKKNAWITSSSEIYHWWEEKRYSKDVNIILNDLKRK